jgi:hypothetical protein
MRLHVAQCLCGPARHAILALAKDASESADALRELLKVAVDEFLAVRGIDSRCGICGAPASQWIYEVGLSREYPDWDTAKRALKDLEAENRATRAVVDGLRRSSSN